MPRERRSLREIRRDAQTVRRDRVLRWLTAESRRAAQLAERTGELRHLGRAAVLAELVDTFTNGEERGCPWRSG